MSEGSICILCGSSGSGKTTALVRMLDLITLTNLTCRGILCPPVFRDGEKTGIDLYDVSTGDVHSLAELNLTRETNLATHGWKLDARVVKLGNEILNLAIPCDILFVDELGPLEFERGEGLMEGFRAINSRAYQFAFVTIRPSLLNAALQRWPDATVFSVIRSDQDSLIMKMLELVKRN